MKIVGTVIAGIGLLAAEVGLYLWVMDHLFDGIDHLFGEKAKHGRQR
jgi:hypothetical protein